MKKLLFLLVTALVSATMSFAQSTLVATLSHGEDISMYYGVYALQAAHSAAVSGDIINLSGGAFQSTDITKAITLRGAGIDDDNPTYIIGSFDISVPASEAGRLSMEGVRCDACINMNGTLNNAYFLKSCFKEFEFKVDCQIKNAMYVDCKITKAYNIRGTSTVQFVNSYVCRFSAWSEATIGASFVNCCLQTDGSQADYMCSSQFVNCIFFNTSYLSNSRLPSSSVATNSVSINNYNNDSSLFGNSSANTGCQTSTFADMFKDFTGTYSDEQTFELTDEAKAKFRGTDGTEVGMHGGIMPYDSTPSYPQITKMNVANKTTADGKLSVEIEINAAK